MELTRLLPYTIEENTVSSLVNKKILIVEDQPEAQKAMKQFLTMNGVIATVAGNGESALDIFKKVVPDCVLLDIKLPGISGFEVLKRIKAIRPKVPVIMTTAIGTIEAVQECMRAGAYAHVIKPIDIDSLQLIIERSLNMTEEASTYVAEEPADAAKNEVSDPLLHAVINVMVEKGLVTRNEILDELRKLR